MGVPVDATSNPFSFTDEGGPTGTLPGGALAGPGFNMTNYLDSLGTYNQANLLGGSSTIAGALGGTASAPIAATGSTASSTTASSSTGSTSGTVSSPGVSSTASSSSPCGTTGSAAVDSTLGWLGAFIRTGSPFASSNCTPSTASAGTPTGLPAIGAYLGNWFVRLAIIAAGGVLLAGAAWALSEQSTERAA